MKLSVLFAIFAAAFGCLRTAASGADSLQVGFAEMEITPPIGFPMAGYYHERLAEGVIDPLKAKAVVFRQGSTQAAWVVCDLIGISADLSDAVRERVFAKTGIPASHIVVSATHTHTAPDYTKALVQFLGKRPQDPLRAGYIELMIDRIAGSIVKAAGDASDAVIEAGAATQQTPVSFNRRFVMRDGSVRTWINLQNPDVVRAAGPIDPQISIVSVRTPGGKTRGVISNFALHLDTVGGARFSADYPSFLEQALRKSAGDGVISLFGTGCCGDINHVDPGTPDRNKADFIGNSLGETICGSLGALPKLEATELRVRSKAVSLPLQSVTREELARGIEVIQAAAKKEKVDFFDHVTAYKKLMLDHLRNREPLVNTDEFLTWGLSRKLAGIGDKLPVEVTVISIGQDLALVYLPGEVFVDLGLAIKQASPFRTTVVIELANAVETIYIPTRAAYAGGSYEVTNSTTQAGSGEMLVEAALGLLRECASAK